GVKDISALFTVMDHAGPACGRWRRWSWSVVSCQFAVASSQLSVASYQLPVRYAAPLRLFVSSSLRLSISQSPQFPLKRLRPPAEIAHKRLEIDRVVFLAHDHLIAVERQQP